MSEEFTLKDLEKRLYTKNEYGVRHQDPNLSLTVEEESFLRGLFDIPAHWHKTCVSCIARQHAKYGENKIKCKGINSELPEGSAELLDELVIEKGIDKERALLVLRASQDPVAWAELMFGFDDRTKGTENEYYIRSYQKEQLRCTAESMVLREGRRTGKSFVIALKLIWLAFNHKVSRGMKDGVPVTTGPQILIVTPYQVQIDNIFQEIEGLLLKCPELADEVLTGNSGSLYAKTPPLRMEFKNRASIKGFVSGVSAKTDGTAGGTIRGQSADIIYLDEMDMIPEPILTNAILPVRLTRRGTRMIATSTPIGKRGHFYNWCKNSPNYKEDHLPTTVLPHWETEKDSILGDQTKDSLMAEYMAEFIEGDNSVFKSEWIRRARFEYEYAKTTSHRYVKERLFVQKPQTLSKCLGIDWNKNAGTEFVVTGYDRDAHRWVVLEATNIPQSEWSSIRWKEEVIRLNQKWELDYIYADEGYGHTIIEDLRAYSLAMQSIEKPDARQKSIARLVNVIKSLNFSSKIILRSPVDGKEIPKSAKDFLIENTIRIFEEDAIAYPLEDEQLFKELENYTVIRRNPSTNKAVYGPKSDKIGDHRLDAFMLSLGGLFLELSEYSPNMYGSSNAHSLDKETLEKRAQVEEADGTVSQFFRDMKKTNVSLDMTALLVYGNDGKILNNPNEAEKLSRLGRRGKPNTSGSAYEHYKELRNVPSGDPDYAQQSEAKVLTRRGFRR